MRERTVNDLMDEFYTIVRTAPTEDATLQLVRHAGTAGNVEAIEALSRLLVIEYTRRCHSDAKWPLIARKAHTTVGVVVSVWVALLEYASQDDERGSVEGFDCETFDALYGYSDGTCEAVLSAMLEKGLIEDGCIRSWSRRQPQREREESTNAERQRRYRERRRLERDGEGVTEEDGNVTGVTTHNVTGVTRNVTRNAVTPRNASVTPPEQNREEQRREEENTHT